MNARRLPRRQPASPTEASAAAPAPAQPVPHRSQALPGAFEAGRPVVIGKWSLPFPAAVCLACLAAAFVFLLLGPYSNFGPTGFLDPWFYTGYFMHFSYLVKTVGVTYYVSRLPWILPGLAVFQIANPAAGTVILNALIMAVCAASLFFIVSWYYGKQPAVLASIALATNPYFIFAVAWDYPDGPAIAYAFVALACFLRPRQGRFPNSLLAGACLALSGYSNLAGIPALLSMMAVPLWRYRQSLGRLAKEVLWILCGGVAATALLIPFSRTMLGCYLFFKPQLDQIQYVRSHPGYLAHMWGSGNAWIPFAFRLAPALVALFLGALVLLARRKRSGAIAPAYLFLAANSILFALFEFVFHNVGLRVAYGSSYMLTPVFGFAGLLIGECWLPERRREGSPLGEERGRSGRAPALFCAAAALFGLALPYCSTLRTLSPAEPARVWTIIALLAVAAGALIFVPRTWRPVSGALSSLVILAGLFLGPACDSSIGYPFDKQNAAGFDSLMKISEAMDTGLAPERRFRFWYDQEPATNVYASEASLWVEGYVDCTSQIPAVPAQSLSDIFHRNTTFVHLTLDPAKIARRREILAARGVVTGNERRWIVPSGFGNIYVVMEDVVDLSAVH